MSKRRISVLVSIVVGLIGLLGLLYHVQPPTVVPHISELFDNHRCADTVPPKSNDANLTGLPSFASFKVPDEVDGFTPHVWQTTGPKPLTEDQKKDMASWRAKHPFFSFTLMTDEQGDSFVREHYEHRPDIVDLYLRLPFAIVKADLFRYLVLAAKGGIYADIDVYCDQPLSNWVPREYIDSANLVIGLEFDFDFRGEGTEVASQFANWVLAAKPGNKHLQRVIDKACAGIVETMKKNNVDFEHLELWMFKDVVNIAGPKMMTFGVLESLSEDLGRLVDDRMISSTKEPRLVGDVLVMPNNAFAAMQAGFPEDRGPILVTHHYAGSWKEEADKAKAEKPNHSIG